MKLRIDSKYIPLLASAVVLIGLYGAGCVALGDRGFMSLKVIIDLFSENSYLGIAAIGATFVILSGGIDLSVGSIVALSGTLIAVLCFNPALNPQAGPMAQLLPAEWLPLDPKIAICIVLVLGALFGMVMGCLIHFFKLPAFLVTLGGMFLARGLAFMVRVNPLAIKHPFYDVTVKQTLRIDIGHGLHIPLHMLCFLGLFVVALYVAHFRKFGRNVYAIGGSEESARLMGLPVAKTRILVYTFAGFCSAFAGVAYTFAITQAKSADVGIGLELDAIAAVVIGGTLLSGGVGFLSGTMIGVLIFGLIPALINYRSNFSPWWTKIIVGALVLLFLLLQNFVTAASRSKRKTG
ncbi:MAG: sugar ABC transporter permease YjfF [Phycisphaerales bacterium]|jgi:galactofuranose transport system permease protein|nr:sugar ABC transporter permease YjfF [Phycisphaerales bacterium]